MFIKPTAPPVDVFQFKANFLRLYADAKSGQLDLNLVSDRLNQFVGRDSDIHVSITTLTEKLLLIQKRHADACRAEILNLLTQTKTEMKL